MFSSAGESNRSDRINAFLALIEHRSQLDNHIIQCEVIDSEFDDVLSRITDWFYNSYVLKVNEIAKKADINTGEILQYYTDISADIDKLNGYFYSSDSISVDDPDYDPDSDTEYDPGDDRAFKAGLFAELSNMYTMFTQDDYVTLKIDENKALIQELGDILNLVEHEGIIGNEGIKTLSDMVNEVTHEYSETDQIAAAEAEIITGRFETGITLQRVWFKEHYTQLVVEISSADREDEYDNVTVSNQISELGYVKQFIDDDNVVSNDFHASINGQIDQLIQDYETELVSINERIEQRDTAAAAAAASAAAASRRNTAASSTNNRTGSGSTGSSNSSSSSGSSSSSSASSGSASGSSGSSSSSSNNSSSSSSSTSGTQNQSNTGSTSAIGGHNNNYPSISSNCREMLARLVKLEAPNECANGKQAVAEVVLNRMISSRWSHATTVEEVIFDTKWGVQFTVKDLVWTDRGTPRAADYSAVDRALAGPNVLSKDYMFFNMSAGNHTDVLWIGLHAFRK